MKKLLPVLAVLAALSLTACGASNAPAAPAPSPEAVTASPAPTPNEPSPVPPSPAEETPDPQAVAPAGSGGIDVDLTQLSSTMVYSEVYAMMFEPEEYLGKTVKMRGMFSAFEGEAGQRYFTCVVQDATACCAQGLEFELTDAYSYPEDYPSPGEEITVVGVFDTYEEELGGSTYYYLVLRDAVLV